MYVPLYGFKHFRDIPVDKYYLTLGKILILTMQTSLKFETVKNCAKIIFLIQKD